MVGWNFGSSQIANLITANTQLLTIQFRAIGAVGATDIDIDTSGSEATPLQLWTAAGTKITTGLTVVDGIVTIQ
jgi:hypothetical protein